MNRHYRNIRITDYSYELPPERIAKYPLAERDRSKLLIWDGKSVTDTVFSELPSLVEPDNLVGFQRHQSDKSPSHFQERDRSCGGGLLPRAARPH